MKVYDLNDTIAAISTPAGEGGIGIIRMSGPDAHATARKLFQPKHPVKKLASHRLYYGEIVDPADGSTLDESLLSYMKAPASYTGEDVVEFNCHGGSLVLQQVMELLLREGIREAGPGEFSKRAFLSGRIDLTQAEAVIDIIRARSDRGLKLAGVQLKGGLKEALQKVREKLLYISAVMEAYIDFPEEDIDADAMSRMEEKLVEAKKNLTEMLATYEEGKVYREGIHVVIAGRPNVGKSSILNALLKEKRAIVTAIPGTTRDMIEEVVNIRGIPVRLVDTAGIRETSDIIEGEGIKRTREKLKQADLLLYVIDNEGIQPPDREVLEKEVSGEVLLIVNKDDLLDEKQKKIKKEEITHFPHVFISAKSDSGMEELKEGIYKIMMKQGSQAMPTVVVSRKRHKIGMERAVNFLSNAQEGLSHGLPYELISADLKEALAGIAEVAGETTSEDVLEKIFGEFCIGK